VGKLKKIILLFMFYIFVAVGYADSQDPPKVQFGVSYELILSNNSDLIDLAGPNSSIGVPTDYVMGAWKFDLDYVLDPKWQTGLGFKAVNGKSLSYTDSSGNGNILDENALGIFAEGRRVFKLSHDFEASVIGDLGYYWLNNASLTNTAVGGGPLGGSNLGVFVGTGLKFYFDKEDNLGMGLEIGYQLLTFSPVSFNGGNLKGGILNNYNGTQATVDMSGFVIMIDCAQVTFDLSPKPKQDNKVPPSDEAPLKTDTPK
jgi:hypothetical protein